MTLTWRKLVELEPALLQLERDAENFAARSDSPWYRGWLWGSTIFQRETRRVAGNHHLPLEQVEDVCERHLIDVFDAGWGRREKRENVVRGVGGLNR